MAEHFMFFDSANPLAPDRTYNAQEFTDYFKALVTTGIMKKTGNDLKVQANGDTMISTIDTGVAFLIGRYYENDSLLALAHEIEAVGKSRIDRVVIRMDLNPDARNVKAVVKRGIASGTPASPALTQTNELYEISLAQVLIVGGQTFISPSSITDERGTDIISPWAGSKILPNFDDSALEDLVNSVEDLKNNGLIDARTETVTYYIRSNGNDINDGLTVDTAFRTFHKAITILKKINFGKRILNVGVGIDMLGPNGIDYRAYEFSNYIGGYIEFHFNGNEYAPQWKNCTANILVKGFKRFESADVINGMQSYFTNCVQAEVVDMTCDRTGIQTSYSVVEFQNVGWGRVASSSMKNVGQPIVTASNNTYVFTWGVSGNVTADTVPYKSNSGSILEVIGNSLTGFTVRDETNTGGQIFGN